MQPKTSTEALSADLREISEIRTVRAISVALDGAARRALSVVDPLEGDALSSSSRRRARYACAYDSIAFVEGGRLLTITWLPPAG